MTKRAPRGAWKGIPQSICAYCGEIFGDAGKNSDCEECGSPMTDATVSDMLSVGYDKDEVTNACDAE